MTALGSDGRIVKQSAGVAIDVRATGTRVRLDSTEHAEAVSAAARDLARSSVLAE